MDTVCIQQDLQLFDVLNQQFCHFSYDSIHFF